MEKIRFTYDYEDEKGPELHVSHSRSEDGLCLKDVCIMFMDFIDAAGFSRERALEYFRE